jgi:hypothetical protein
MQRIIRYCGILCLLAVLHSCSEDFKIGAPYKEVTVAYGLLDAGDTAHYIKITRGFLDEKNSNLVTAKNLDSVYFDTLNVILQQLNSSGTVLNTTTLQKVNLINDSIIKDTGVFANTPSYAYKTKQTLVPGAKYRLTITNPKSGKIVTAETFVLASDVTSFPVSLLPGTTLDYYTINDVLDFNFTAPNNSAIIEMYLQMHYFEIIRTATDSSGTYKDVAVPFFTRRAVVGGAMSHTFQFKDLYGLIGSGYVSTGTNIRRLVDTNEVVYYVGGSELKRYMDLTSAQGGITSDQIQPTFTNFSGGDVYGIFSSRVKRVIPRIPFGKPTIDSLTLSPAAAFLRISGITPY